MITTSKKKIKNKLLYIKKFSLLKNTIFFFSSVKFVFKIKIIREKNIINIIIPNINNPLSGSLAKVCTEFNIPDRTKKVPNKLNEKVKIANNAVHDLNVLFFYCSIFRDFYFQTF